MLFETDPGRARAIALDTVVDKLDAHLTAVADHVAVQAIGIEPGRSAMPRRRRSATPSSPPEQPVGARLNQIVSSGV
ncbi:hypothetical protein Acsp04_23900 [Actinomadura sp. NBRC 104425]|uniref:hypothetical protein n=1 Tax=Actinomadura sp. NBRC 104425 TaxID=3032204 RepID=UPI0024A36D34|nr:hypothetical protein [Actinomadura sp. NBRC 104425]GLZ12155.1 hypothetical protein Acsp04_23900 [Actinomadura sp. NBRC 104425]